LKRSTCSSFFVFPRRMVGASDSVAECALAPAKRRAAWEITRASAQGTTHSELPDVPGAGGTPVVGVASSVRTSGGAEDSIAKLESRGSRGFREISDFELELASASL
jgi:hypothetical protein